MIENVVDLVAHNHLTEGGAPPFGDERGTEDGIARYAKRDA